MDLKHKNTTSRAYQETHTPHTTNRKQNMVLFSSNNWNLDTFKLYKVKIKFLNLKSPSIYGNATFCKH